MSTGVDVSFLHDWEENKKLNEFSDGLNAASDGI